MTIYTLSIQYVYMQTQTLNISLPKDLVKRIDSFAKKEYRNRSEFIREAVRIYLKDLEDWEEIYRFGREAGKRIGIKSEQDANKIVYEYRHEKKP